MDVRQIIGEDIQGSEGVEISPESFAFENLERELLRGFAPVVKQVANAIARGLAEGLTANPRAQKKYGIEDLSNLNEVFESSLTRLFLDSASDKVSKNVTITASNLDDIASLAEAWALRVKGR